ncbi:hypothetical protein A1O1_07804 [Capronia coronata CBS 617.96]|uniref:Uncharacterized protein n=1 Tax=Capronia coronata CBS 617.96 TaxID=1182541 RepID=W9YHI1_9EURO|nr:uncharacterized protein A1O1_07804 [Capronia coronata CBS 617.96]EXJ81739.1 hypothetical protein A1O1_07804 [Capronia coronata CBS 617.96]
MAAAEYFASGARPPYEQSNSLFPPSQPQRAHSQPGHPYRPPQLGHSSPQLRPQSVQYAPPPPPYQSHTDDGNPNAQFAHRPAAQSQHRPSLPDQSRPQPYSINQHNQHAQQLTAYQPGSFVPQAYPYQQQQHFYPPYRSSPNYSSVDLGVGNGYSSDPERHRRKHKSQPRRISESSRSTNTDGFLGAAGGGLLGDMLFPGLGTVGGALFGWVGGKDYAKHRRWREEKRDRDQERWERKFGSSRSRSHSRDGRRRNHDQQKGYD